VDSTAWFVVIFGSGAMIHLLVGLTYFAFGLTAHRLLGLWLTVAWAIGLFRLMQLVMFGIPDALNPLVWLHIDAAALVVLISQWWRGAREGFPS
jgi:cellobiose-specific phosphotransferase system component IIC